MAEMNEHKATQLLEDAAYARLKSSEALGGSLIGEKDSVRARAILEEIISNGEKTLDQLGDLANPHLLSYTHMTMAAAQVDLADLEPNEATRAELISTGVEHCGVALAVALESEATIVSTVVIPWTMVVLAGALRTAQGLQRQDIEARLLTCIQELAEVFEKQKLDRKKGAQTLFVSQCLLEGALSADKPSERKIVLQRALELVHDALRTLLGAGDFEVARQARATTSEIEAALNGTEKSLGITMRQVKCSQCGAVNSGMQTYCLVCQALLAKSSLATQPADKYGYCTQCGAQLRDGASFCTQCGTQIKRRL